jgi:hypothetical protein
MFALCRVVHDHNSVHLSVRKLSLRITQHICIKVLRKSGISFFARTVQLYLLRSWFRIIAGNPLAARINLVFAGRSHP